MLLDDALHYPLTILCLSYVVVDELYYYFVVGVVGQCAGCPAKPGADPG